MAFRLLFCAYGRRDMTSEGKEAPVAVNSDRTASPWRWDASVDASAKALPKRRDDLPTLIDEAMQRCFMDLEGFKACMTDVQFSGQVRRSFPVLSLHAFTWRGVCARA